MRIDIEPTAADFERVDHEVENGREKLRYSSQSATRQNASRGSVRSGAERACAVCRWACSAADRPQREPRGRVLGTLRPGLQLAARALSAPGHFVISGAGRTLEGVLPPIVNGDPGDETAED
jgi:hypothetical protein